MFRLICFAVAYIVFCFSTLLHEWAHSLAAVMFGVKQNVFDINYSFLPFLLGIEENVDYTLVVELPRWQAIIVAGAGLISNGILAILALFAANLCHRIVPLLLCFTVAFFNISDWFNYLTLRVIFLRGDTMNMVQYGVNHTLLMIMGFISSMVFVYLLFGPLLTKTKTVIFASLEDRKSFAKMVGIVFILMQFGELFNDLVMYG